jgi:hypothetical protein
MKHNFCTLFDKNYLFKGLTLYGSLLAHCHDFHLWILCMDEVAYEVLTRLRLEKASLIKMQDFEDEALKRIKPTRSTVEYCWTCTPSLPLYVLKNNPSLEMVTYLDADLFFYDNPDPLIEEMGDNSIMIIEHRFSDHLKHLEMYGIYNVSILTFRNDPRGLECLQWWRDRCNEWCFYRHEDGKFADQKYLDDWTRRFQGVHVLQYAGAGLALWNIAKYDIKLKSEKIFVDDVPLIFYHFHWFHLLRDKKYDWIFADNVPVIFYHLYKFALLRNRKYDYGDQDVNYGPLTPENKELIYTPYIAATEASVKMVRKISPRYDHGYKTFKEQSDPADQNKFELFRYTLSIPGKIKSKLNVLLKWR